MYDVCLGYNATGYVWQLEKIVDLILSFYLCGGSGDGTKIFMLTCSLTQVAKSLILCAYMLRHCIFIFIDHVIIM